VPLPQRSHVAPDKLINNHRIDWKSTRPSVPPCVLSKVFRAFLRSDRFWGKKKQ
jgi:hypothetical protein